MIIKWVRLVLGNLIVFGNFVTRPSQKKRSLEEQAKVDAETSHMKLYQFRLCPFCVRVRRVLHRLNLSLEICDAKEDAGHREALLLGGGKVQVPCLRIDEGEKVTWLYESKAIVSFLEKRFG